MQLMSTEDTVISVLTGARDHGRPAPSTYQLAAGMNTVASRLRPTLDRLAEAGKVVRVDADVPAGVEVMPGDQRWALASGDRSLTT